MSFSTKLDDLTKIMFEVSDLQGLNVEWYEDLQEWKNCIWSWVNKLEPYKTRENIPAIKASIISLEDNKTLQRFRDFGSKPTYHYYSLEKLRYFLEKGDYTHLFILGIGELNEEQILEFKKWISNKLS